LEQAGLSKDIITTVRKRGFILALDVEVTSCLNVAESNINNFSKNQINSPIVESDNENVGNNLLVCKKLPFKSKTILNIPVWVLLLLIFMTGINIVLLYFNVTL